MLAAKRILVLAPHTDDGELGCGGTISKYVQQNTEVIYVAFSSCVDSLPEHLPPHTLMNECKKATASLGIKETILLDYKVREMPSNRQEILDALIRLHKQYRPQAVFLPAKNDVHQDHQVVYAEGLRAFKFCTVLGYELPWNNTQFYPTLFESITHDAVQRKITSLKEYKSQAHRTYMQEDFVTSLAKLRGVQADTAYAEAFEIYKMIH